MSTPIPFVDYKNYVVSGISNTSEVIFEEDFVSELDSVWITNTVEELINVTVYILKGSEITNIRYVKIEPLDSVDLLKGSIWTIDVGDILYAYSDFSTKLFNSFISYRLLNQLGGS